MGMTKAIMEKLMISKSRNLPNDGNTTLCATRYGNVMASRGSVIPLFIKQCKENKPLTVTDPNMTRFLMSLDESVNLVLFAFNNAVNGDIFVQKAPACTIMDLALAIKEIFNPNVEIKIIGTRHGEKTYETLINKEDMIKAVDMGNFYKIPADNRDLNYDKYFIEGSEEVSHIEDYHSHNTARLDVEGMKKLLLKLNFIREDLGLQERAKGKEIRSE